MKPNITVSPGQKYGRWTVLNRADDVITKDNRNIRHWLCRCECGTVRVVRESSLKSGKSSSCGCYHSEKMKSVAGGINLTHGQSSSRLYRIWRHMLNRCYYDNDIRFSSYGGRGIEVCSQWHSFEPFYEWANQNGYKDGLSIDRIDVNGNYEPGKCRWSGNIEQANNKRSCRYYTYQGETLTIAEWAKRYNMNYKKLWKRLERGWSIDKSLSYI